MAAVSPKPPAKQPATSSKITAIINCLNALSPKTKLERIEQLDDGVIFSDLMQVLDPNIEPPTLIKPINSWVDKQSNLEAVFRVLNRYLVSIPSLDWLPYTYEPRRIARNPEDPEHLCDAAFIFIYVAMSGPNVEKLLLPIVGKLSNPEKALIKQLHEIKEKQKNDILDPPENAKDADGPAHVELQMEEDRAKMAALQRQNADLNTRLEHAKLANEDLKEDNARIRDELDEARKNQAGSTDARIKALEERIREGDDLIQSQEAKIEEDREMLARYRQEIATLSKAAEKVRPLEDEVTVLKCEVEELSKKANAASRYKEKLERMARFENDAKTLQYEKEAMEGKLKNMETIQMKLEAAEQTIANYRQWQQNSESEMFGVQQQRGKFLDKIAQREEEIQRLKDQRTIHEEMINDLQEQITSNGLIVSSSPEPGQQSDEQMVALKLEMTKLKAENNLLRNNMGIASSNEQLRADLEASRRNEARLTERLHEVRKDYAVAQDQLQGILSNTTDEGSQLFRDLQRTMFQSRQDLDRAREHSRKIETELRDKDRELLSLKTDYKIATKDSVDALEELKNTDQLISNSLRDELESLRTAYEGLKMDTQEQQKQLIEALVSREKLRKELEEAPAGKEAAPSPAGGESGLAGLDRDASSELMAKQAEKLEKLKEKCQSLLLTWNFCYPTKAIAEDRAGTVRSATASQGRRGRRSLFFTQGRHGPNYQEPPVGERNDLDCVARPRQPTPEQPRGVAAAAGDAQELAGAAEVHGDDDAQEVGAPGRLGVPELLVAAHLYFPAPPPRPALDAAADRHRGPLRSDAGEDGSRLYLFGAQQLQLRQQQQQQQQQLQLQQRWRRRKQRQRQRWRGWGWDRHRHRLHLIPSRVMAVALFLVRLLLPLPMFWTSPSLGPRHTPSLCFTLFSFLSFSFWMFAFCVAKVIYLFVSLSI